MNQIPAQGNKQNKSALPNESIWLGLGNLAAKASAQSIYSALTLDSFLDSYCLPMPMIPLLTSK